MRARGPVTGTGTGSEQLWLGDDDPPHGRSPVSRWRQVGTAAAVAACLSAVGVPLGLVLSGGPTAGHTSHRTGPSHLTTGPAEKRVIAALSATTDAGSFDFSYALSETGRTTGEGVSGTGCAMVTTGGDSEHVITPAPSLSPSSASLCTNANASKPAHRTVVSGKGTFDTDPVAMVVSSSFGESARLDATAIWIGGTGTGLAPSTGSNTSNPGTPLTGFANLVEGALGRRAGGAGLLAAASPTGYLDLDETEVTGADQVGSATVGGVSVTEYEVSLDPTALTSGSAGTTSEEDGAIQAALSDLRAQGLSTLTAHLFVDASGYIRRATTVTSFSDGGTVTLTTTLSDFGCAGTVLMPGQQGSTTPRAGCTSPDTGVAPTTTTTATAPAG